MTSRGLILLTVTLGAIAVTLAAFVFSRPVETNLQVWRLPAALREVSGLAVLDNDHVLMVTDEVSTVYQLSLRTGDVLPFEPVDRIKGDFEGIERWNGATWLVTSKGQLYRHVDASWEAVPTPLKEICEVEGLDSLEEGLLILCKTNYQAADADRLMVFLFEPETGVMSRFLSVPVSESVNPSAIAKSPTGFVVLAARQQRLLTIDRVDPADEDAEPNDRRWLVRREKLRGHDQAEGVALMPDGRLVIADEGQGQGGKVTIYPSLN